MPDFLLNSDFLNVIAKEVIEFIFSGYLLCCFSLILVIARGLRFYMIKEICGTNPRNLFLFSHITPPGTEKTEYFICILKH